MPLYEYECKKCHHRFERIQKFSDPYVKKCPDCGGPVEMVVSAPAVQFKGSGWYVTDYAKKSSATSPTNGESGSKPDSGSKSDSDSKADSSKTGSESKGEPESKSKKEEKSKQDSSTSSKKPEKKSSSREKS